jgi:hypothetical protein
MWKLGLRPRYSFSGIFVSKFRYFVFAVLLLFSSFLPPFSLLLLYYPLCSHPLPLFFPLIFTLSPLPESHSFLNSLLHTDKKENQIVLIYREIQSGAVAKSYMTNGLLIYGEIFANFLIY